jgi:hypothetical protein
MTTQTTSSTVTPGTTANARAGEAACCPEQLATGLSLHRPALLYHSRFPRHRMLFENHGRQAHLHASTAATATALTTTASDL